MVVGRGQCGRQPARISQRVQTASVDNGKRSLRCTYGRVPVVCEIDL